MKRQVCIGLLVVLGALALMGFGVPLRTAAAQPPGVDVTAPNIISVSTDPSILWPPNHKLRDVTVYADLADDTDPMPDFRIISVSSNEPETGEGTGNTAPDWVITGDHTVQLRAERGGKGSGRVYTITIEAFDESGNTAQATVTVSVPHDKGKKVGHNK